MYTEYKVKKIKKETKRLDNRSMVFKNILSSKRHQEDCIQMGLTTKTQIAVHSKEHGEKGGAEGKLLF
jgi:hypothetical protein